MIYLSTLIAGFVFSILLFSIWVPLVDKLGAKGGFISAFLIIGMCWYLNHGSQFHLIHQTSSIFVDMGFAAGFGSLFYGLAKGGSFEASLYILASALCGGFLAGMIL